MLLMAFCSRFAVAELVLMTCWEHAERLNPNTHKVKYFKTHSFTKYPYIIIFTTVNLIIFIFKMSFKQQRKVDFLHALSSD